MSNPSEPGRPQASAYPTPQGGAPVVAAGQTTGSLKFGRIDAALEDVELAIDRAREGVLSRQLPDGYWNGELEADSMLKADYIFLHTLLGTGDEGKMRRGLMEIFRFRNDDGSWSLYPGGPGNISLTVKCYFAAKLMG